MAAIDDLKAAIGVLATAADNLEARLPAYPPDQYTVDINNTTLSIGLMITFLNELAPTPPGRALELTAVE